MKPTLLGLLVVLGALCALPASAAELSVAADGAVLSGGTLHLEVTAGGEGWDGEQEVRILAGGGLLHTVVLGPGEHQVAVPDAGLGSGEHTIAVEGAGERAEITVRPLPGWLSVIPPLVAIGLALIFREVIVSLVAGVYIGALSLYGWNPITAFARTIDQFVAPALADPDQSKVLLFSALLGGMVGVLTKSGGALGIVERLRPLATNPRRGQVATWLMGILVFFDDYANSLIVGSTMRPITDKLRISREKLAYIVDSTAAPIASIMPISTWVGFEVGLLAAAFNQLGLDFDPYTTFVAAIPYNFYPILALVLGLTIAVSRRDFGPMLKAERRAIASGEVLAAGDTALADYTSDELEPPAGKPRRAANALVPIITVIALTVLGLYVTGASGLERADYGGTGEWLRAVLSEADSFSALLWASFGGVAVAIVLATVGRVLSIGEAMRGMLGGFKAMMVAFVVLILAWSLGSVCGELHTAEFLVGLTAGVLQPELLPLLIFVISAAVAFSTGTSWATMTILVPLGVPILHGLAIGDGHAVGSPTYWSLMLGTVASVLAGSVWGDHCSPISDTTILSSMGSGCDHIAHVRTQLPYALSVGVLGMAVGNLPTAFGLSPWISILVGTAVIVAGVRFFGRTTGESGASPSADSRNREPASTG